MISYPAPRRRLLSVGILVVVSLSGCADRINNYIGQLENNGNYTTGYFTPGGPWLEKYSWDCSRQRSQGVDTAGHFQLTVVNADDGSTAAENPVTTRAGLKGSGTLRFRRDGYYRLQINSDCSWKVRADRLDQSAEARVKVPHGTVPLDVRFLGSAKNGTCPADAPGQVTCAEVNDVAVATPLERLTLARVVFLPKTNAFKNQGVNPGGCGSVSTRGTITDADDDALDFTADGEYCTTYDTATYQFNITGASGALQGTTGNGFIYVAPGGSVERWQGTLRIP